MQKTQIAVLLQSCNILRSKYRQILLIHAAYNGIFREFSVQIKKKVVLFCVVWVENSKIFEILSFFQNCQRIVSE